MYLVDRRPEQVGVGIVLLCCDRVVMAWVSDRDLGLAKAGEATTQSRETTNTTYSVTSWERRYSISH